MRYSNIFKPNVNGFKFSKLRIYIDTLSFKNYLILLLIIQLFAYYLSYKNLFNYLGCTENITRYFISHNYYFELNYPKMCDEQYYFFGFESINKIYVEDYVYQDRPLYLLIGFIIHKILFLFNPILQIEKISLLLLTSLTIQILVVNLIAFLISKLISNKFERFYFILFYLLTLFSFEERFYFFLPSNSTIYFLIFIYSIYSVKNNKLNGFNYGLLFTVSGYGVIGFLYQLLFKLPKFRRNMNLIFKNIIFFTLPSIAFEVYRILLGQFQGEQYGVKYIYNAEVYNQFVWFFNSIFVKNYSSDIECQNLSEFVNCYLFETRFFFSIMMFYTLILLFLIVLFLIKYKFDFFDDFKLIIAFTLFSYLFIAFQGLYGFRFIYYSFGFCISLLICYFIFYLENELLALSIVILYSHYTILRADWFEYNLNFSNIEYFLIASVILLSLFEVINLNKYKSES